MGSMEQADRQHMDVVTCAGRMALWIFVLLFSAISSAKDGEKCRFPKEWKGRWFQAGLGQVVLRHGSFSSKGICHAQDRDYYLLHNKEKKCFQCVLMIKPHRNILQYKESFCVPERSLEHACRSIRAEDMLYTMVRENANAVRCPFQEAYYFDYDSNMSGFCPTSLSYVNPCETDTRLRFHFKHCSHKAIFRNENLNFLCLASWKDGSDNYMYGQFHAASIESKDESYRCFKYTTLGTDLYLAMSADATCIGLRSAQDGPINFRFNKDMFGWSSPACRFPSWLTNQTLWDMTGRNQYVSDTRGEVLQQQYQKKKDSDSQTRAAYRCVEIMKENYTEQLFIGVSFSSASCVSKHQCIKISRKAENLYVIQEGELHDYEKSDKCLGERHWSKGVLLFGDRGVTCPYSGVYRGEATSHACRVDLKTGCSQDSNMDVTVVCGNETSTENGLTCVANWKEDEDRYVVVRKTDSNERQIIGCFQYRVDRKGIHFINDVTCDSEAPIRLNLPRTTFTMSILPEKCGNSLDEFLQKDIRDSLMRTSTTASPATYKHLLTPAPVLLTTSTILPKLRDVVDIPVETYKKTEEAQKTYVQHKIQDTEKDRVYVPQVERSQRHQKETIDKPYLEFVIPIESTSQPSQHLSPNHFSNSCCDRTLSRRLTGFLLCLLLKLAVGNT